MALKLHVGMNERTIGKFLEHTILVHSIYMVVCPKASSRHAIFPLPCSGSDLYLPTYTYIPTILRERSIFMGIQDREMSGG